MNLQQWTLQMHNLLLFPQHKALDLPASLITDHFPTNVPKEGMTCTFMPLMTLQAMMRERALALSGYQIYPQDQTAIRAPPVLLHAPAHLAVCHIQDCPILTLAPTI